MFLLINQPFLCPKSIFLKKPVFSPFLLPQYLNYWFESNAWHLRCVNPAGGKIYLYGVMTFELSCSIGDNDNP